MEARHTCEAVVLHCIDFRFQKFLCEYLEKHFPGGYDRISVAGSVKRLLSDPSKDNFLLEQLRISQKLHSPSALVLIQHEDCGAYGGSKQFQSIAQETDFQRQELETAKVLLREHFPQQQIETIFIHLSGEITHTSV